MSAASQTTLESAELARYSRHILLQEIGVSGQERLKASKALIIGAGGLGCPASLYLAAAGVGTLGIADFDTVELHNLQRQILHGTSDLGQSKTESAKRSLAEINPHLRIELHNDGVTPENAIELFSAYDVIVDGTDNFATRYLNNDAAFFARKPLVYGSIFKFEGQVSLFDTASGGPCYRCLFPVPPPPGSVPNCGEAGVVGALPGIIGSLQAMEAIKRLLSIGESLLGRLLFADTLTMRFRTLSLKRDSGCPLCGNAPSITSVQADRYEAISCATPDTAEDAPAAEANGEELPLEIDIERTRALIGQGAALLDVREDYERAICAIDGSIHVPMNSIPQRLDELPRDKPLLVHCHHGGRSRNVVRYLRQQGFDNAVNVDGGIDAWAVRLDPGMQRY